MVQGLHAHLKVPQVCQTCLRAKQTRVSFAGTHPRSPHKLERVYNNLSGRFPVPSFSRCQYYITFVDDCTRMVWVYFLQTKDQAFESFCRFKAMAENQSDHRIKSLQTDGGGEYLSSQFADFLSANGIIHLVTPPYTPEANGVPERMNRTITEPARCMMKHAMAPEYLWAEAINTAATVCNFCPTKTLDDLTPYEAWTRRKPNVEHVSYGAVRHLSTFQRPWMRSWKPTQLTTPCRLRRSHLEEQL